jgi:hypothetical protein
MSAASLQSSPLQWRGLLSNTVSVATRAPPRSRGRVISERIRKICTAHGAGGRKKSRPTGRLCFEASAS